jgi:hypothetical protein
MREARDESQRQQNWVIQKTQEGQKLLLQEVQDQIHNVERQFSEVTTSVQKMQSLSTRSLEQQQALGNVLNLTQEGLLRLTEKLEKLEAQPKEVSETRSIHGKPKAQSTPVRAPEIQEPGENLSDPESMTPRSRSPRTPDPEMDQSRPPQNVIDAEALLTSFVTIISGTSESRKSRKKMELKPPKFDGKKPFEPFIRQFRACSKHNEWDEREQRAQLANCLEGQAQQILWDSEIQVQTYSELEALLQKRYGAELQQDKHHLELKARKRRAKESLTDLHQDIRRLWTLAQLPLEGRSANALMIESFLDALNNPSLAHEVHWDKPKSYDEALNSALMAESLFTETKRARELAQAIKER